MMVNKGGNMKIKTGLLTIVLALLMGCAHLGIDSGNKYISWAERYPDAAATMKIPALGECMEYKDGTTYCLTGEIQVPVPEGSTVLEMDKDAVRFIQRIDTDRYDKNLDGEADMYFLLIYLPNLQKYSALSLLINDRDMFFIMSWSQIREEYKKLTGNDIEDDWNTREMNIPTKEEKTDDKTF